MFFRKVTEWKQTLVLSLTSTMKQAKDYLLTYKYISEDIFQQENLTILSIQMSSSYFEFCFWSQDFHMLCNYIQNLQN